MFGRVISAFDRFFASLRRPSRRQAAALCWRRGDEGAIEILLITTRRTGRWTPPKGGLIDGKSASDAAATEAWEEAGAVGDPAPTPVGVYEYMKFRKDGRWERLAVDVFSIEIREMLESFPEKGQRTLRWSPQEKAAGMVQEPDLARIIGRFAP